MVKKNADGSIEVSFELSKAQVQYLSETPFGTLRLSCGGELLVPEVDETGNLWLAFSWSSIAKRLALEALYCRPDEGCGSERERRPLSTPNYRTMTPLPLGEKPPIRVRESAVLCFRNGCVAAYVEQEDGTYKVVIRGDMYPRHLRLINQVVDLFRECSKEDRPAKVRGPNAKSGA